MERFSIRGVVCPIYSSHSWFWLLLYLFDQRLQPVRLLKRPVHISECRGDEIRLKIAIEQRTRPSGRNQRSKEILVEAPPANDVHALVVAPGKRTNHGQRKRYSVGQFFFSQEGRR